MFDNKKHKYESDIVLGKRYEDPQTGIKGCATGIHFYQYGCPTSWISPSLLTNSSVTRSLDAPRLQDVETKQRATTERTGGPGSPLEHRSVPSRR